MQGSDERANEKCHTTRGAAVEISIVTNKRFSQGQDEQCENIYVREKGVK
jgi:hypothetical protein